MSYYLEGSKYILKISTEDCSVRKSRLEIDNINILKMYSLPENIITKAEPNVTFTVAGREDGKGYYSTFGRDSEIGVVVI